MNLSLEISNYIPPEKGAESLQTGACGAADSLQACSAAPPGLDTGHCLMSAQCTQTGGRNNGVIELGTETRHNRHSRSNNVDGPWSWSNLPEKEDIGHKKTTRPGVDGVNIYFRHR